MNRRRLLLIGTAALVVGSIPRPGFCVFGIGDIVFDPAALQQQLVSYAKQAASYVTQLQQAQSELNSYLALARSGLVLPQMVWGMAQSDIATVRNLANGASMLAGGAGGIMTRLNNAGAYANSLSMTPAMLAGQFQSYQATFANADQTLGRVLRTANTDGTLIAARQATIEQQAQAAAGQTQAIQAGVSMTSLVSDQLQTMQVTMASLAQEIGTKDMIEAERAARSDEAWAEYIGNNQAFQTTGHVAGP